MFSSSTWKWRPSSSDFDGDSSATESASSGFTRPARVASSSVASDVGEGGSNCVAGFRLPANDLGNGAAARCRDFHHRLVSFDFENVLIGGNCITGSDQDFANRGFSHGFSKLWHVDGKAGHRSCYRLGLRDHPKNSVIRQFVKFSNGPTFVCRRNSLP